MIPLNDHFIYISSLDAHYILYSGPNSQTPYGDIVCEGKTYKLNDTFKFGGFTHGGQLLTTSTPMFNGQSQTLTSSIIWFGGFAASYHEDNGHDTTQSQQFLNYDYYSQVVSYYPWQRDFNLHFDATSQNLQFSETTTPMDI
eukprot:1003146_1